MPNLEPPPASDSMPVQHWIELNLVAANVRGAMTVAQALAFEYANTAEVICGRCGARFPAPNGSIAGYLRTRLAEFSAPDAYVQIVVRHRGPAPTFPGPFGRTRG